MVRNAGLGFSVDIRVPTKLRFDDTLSQGYRETSGIHELMGIEYRYGIWVCQVAPKFGPNSPSMVFFDPATMDFVDPRLPRETQRSKTPPKDLLPAGVGE